MTWSGVLGGYGVGQANANGMRLLTLCAEHDLTITNTLFQQKNKYKTSWMNPRSKHWHLIDYIILRRSDIGDVLITRAMRGAECWTDYHMIIAKLHISVCPPLRLRRSSKKRIHCTRLEKVEVRNEFRRSLADKLREIEPGLSSEDSMDQKWASISSSLYEAAAQTIGYSGKKHQDWFNDNSDTIKTLLDNMHKAHRATLNNPSSGSIRQQWQVSGREIQKTMRTMQNEWWTRKAQEIQMYADKKDVHNFYNSVKNIYCMAQKIALSPP